MTSPIGPISNPFPNALNSATGSHGARTANTVGSAETPSSQQETVRPTPPSGPLGQNVNTTA